MKSKPIAGMARSYDAWAKLPLIFQQSAAEGAQPDCNMTDVRAEAARALAEVVGGASLRVVAGRYQARIADARDRALLTALVSEGARWWLRYAPALANMLEKPLPKRESEVQALLVLGLVQLEPMQMPAYAAVASTVEAMRALGRPRYAGLANALLRRWQRERDTILPRLEGKPETAHACPYWLIEALRADWPPQADAILTASNQLPTPTLRVNRRHGTRDAFLARCTEAGVAANASTWLVDAVQLDEHQDITALPGFAAGAFSVQDGAAQLAADLLDPRDGMRVLDACAAPGGKSAHLLECADIELLALDRDATRLCRVQENLARLRLHANIQEGDAATPDNWWDGRRFDRILIDAPCSATGVIRRHPDIKLHRRREDTAKLAAQQRALLDALWPLLQAGGRLLYATCSLLRAENEVVVDAFLKQHADASVITLKPRAGARAGPGWQLLPGNDGVDGMFYALLERSAA